MKTLAAILSASALALTACAPMVGQNSNQRLPNGLAPGQPGFSVAPANAPSGPVVHDFALRVLNDIQSASILERREYCGYILVDASGQLFATPPVAGQQTTCNILEPQIGQGVIASYHSHGAYNPSLSGEIPSSVDLVADFNYGIDGYISTPSGRAWHVDFQTRSARMLCGSGCLISDPAFRGDAFAVQTSYTEAEIRRLAPFGF